jgi:hypothetical protein
MKPKEFSAWHLTEDQKLSLVGIVAHRLLQVDPSGRGIRLADFLGSLYPPRSGDGCDETRGALEKLTRSDGRPPESARVGRIFGAYKNQPLPGGLLLMSPSFDVAHNCVLWTARGKPGAPAPVMTGSEAVVPAVDSPTRRPVADDTPFCRERIERFVGEWLLKHKELPGYEAVSVAGTLAADLAVRGSGERIVLVMYARDMVTDPRVRLPLAHWKALEQAQAQGAEILVCMCNDDPGYMSLNHYADYLAHNRTVEGDVVSWHRDVAAWFENFKVVVPHIQSLRVTVTSTTPFANSPKLSSFLKNVLRQEPELAAAVERGWLLSAMPPETGLVNYWAQRCEVEAAIDLYVCIYPAPRAGIPGRIPTCKVRLDLCPAALTFSDIQLQAALDGVAAILAETDPDVAEALGQRTTMAPQGRDSMLVVTPRVISFLCAGTMGVKVGELLYEHASRLRPKRLGLRTR